MASARPVEVSGKVLVLDEPTASPDRNKADRLFEVIRGLKSRSPAISFITDFLDQVFAISDRVTILRDGKLVKSQPMIALTGTDVMRDRQMVAKLSGRDISPAGIVQAIAAQAGVA